MSEFSSEFVVSNQSELEDLAWELEASAGQFSLMLVRCNYVRLREQLVEALRQSCPLKIQVMVLDTSETALYRRIQAELRETLPGVLMVFGLESVSPLEQLLSTANQVREEFRKNCPFPVVLWVTDDVQRVLVNAASDLESWATKTYFTLPSEGLKQGLQTANDHLFSSLLSSDAAQTFDIRYPNLDLGLLKPSEVSLAIEELQEVGQTLSLTLQAGMDFIQGLQADEPTAALAYFERSLQFWQETLTTAEFTPEVDHTLRQGLLLFYMAQVQYAIATADPELTDCNRVRQLLQQSIVCFGQRQRPDLVMRCIPLLERTLQKLKVWDELAVVAQQGMALHRTYGRQTRLSQDYGYLALAALEQQQWPTAKEAAQQALTELDLSPNSLGWLRGLYLMLLAQVEQQLGEEERAIAHLVEANAGAVSDAGYPKFAIQILDELRSLYFERKRYLEAFQAKQEKLSIEQQYGIRAFIGAGRLQPRRQEVVTEFQFPAQGTVAPEIEAAGRRQDLDRLIERIGRSDLKLIAIYGGSGVGKSSLVNAGLVPALKQRAIGYYENVPVLLRQYNRWAISLEQALLDATADRTGQPAALAHIDSTRAMEGIFQQLRENERHNLRTILIFDQFEEFFFVQPDPALRLLFLRFLSRCLQTTADISRVKVVLSLREDYLHYLLELNRVPAFGQTGIDILSHNVLYELGNFYSPDAQKIIQSLTERANFYLEPALIDRLVADLSQGIGAVRPIEMQVVGAQLQEENITTLAQYSNSGTKVDLVSRYLSGVVNDCGPENQKLADLVLYLLTDEKGTCPLKTQDEIEQDLSTFQIIPSTENLDLVLHILASSGLVVLLPETPANRYQLVHDYIAAFIRQQQSHGLISQLQKERELRNLTEAELRQTLRKLEATLKNAQFATSCFSARALFNSGLELEALIKAIEAGKELETSEEASIDSRIRVLTTLSHITFEIIESNRLSTITRVSSVCFSPDGQIVASAGNDGLIRLWTLDGELLRTLESHQGGINNVCFSPNGQIIASAGNDGAVKLWSLSGEKLRTLKEHSKGLSKHKCRASSVCFSPDSQIIASARGDGTVKIWNLDGELLNTLEGHDSEVNSVCFSPDGQMLASASGGGYINSDNTINIWNSEGEKLRTLRGHKSGVSSICFSPNSRIIVSASGDNTIRFWNTNGKTIKILRGHTESIRSVAFSPDGKMIASGSIDKTIILWNRYGQKLKVIKGHSSWVDGLNFSPDSKILISSDFDGFVRFWNLGNKGLKTFTCFKDKKSDQQIYSVRFSPENNKILMAGISEFKLLSTDGQELKTFEGHRNDEGNFVWGFSSRGMVGPSNIAIFSSDKTKIATAGSHIIKLWSLSGRELRVYSGHTSYVTSIVFSPDSQTILSGSVDGTIRLWNISGEELAVIRGHKGGVNSVCFSSASKIIASAGADKKIKLWDQSGRKIRVFSGHTDVITSVEFSSDGKTLVSTSLDKTIRLWNLDGVELGTFKGHSSTVWRAIFSPSDEFIVSASADSTVKIWNLSGEELETFTQHKDEVRDVSMTSDGKTLVSVGEDGKVIFWNLNLEDLIKRGCIWIQNYLAKNSDLKQHEF